MYNFQYVPKDEYKPIKEQIKQLIYEVQDEVRDHFTFRFDFIGSTKRNMITRDIKSNIGFDFDVNIEVNDDEENYSATDIRTSLKEAITRVSRGYGFNKCEDSTRVITIKKINHWNSSIDYSCDFAIVYGNQYIRLNKKSQKYIWAYQSKGYEHLEERADILKHDKNKKYWNEVRETYLYKKNVNDSPDKHSRSLYAETINEIYKWYLNEKNK